MKLVETYYFNVIVPVGYEEAILDSIEQVVPLTWGHYDRVTRISSPKTLRCRVRAGANPNAVTADGSKIDAAEGDLLQLECVSIEFSIYSGVLALL